MTHGLTNSINIADFEPVCTPLTDTENAVIQKEISDYENNHRFEAKILEVQGLKKVDSRQQAIVKYLQGTVFRSCLSVLDLGCAAGSPLRLVSDALASMGGHGNLTGIELVPGWVTAGNKALQNVATLVEGDVTDFFLGSPAPQYDLVMMNDVLEHVMTKRYACLFQTISIHTTRPGSFVYFHIPAPLTQLNERGQYFENVVPPHVIVQGLATYSFELYDFSQDHEIGVLNSHGTPKYIHMLFRKAETPNVFSSAERNI